MDYQDMVNAVNAQVAQNNSWSAEQAQKQMDFQERLSNTAHQREVADLKAAGLNPVLSAHTNGASTPSGAMAQGDNSGTMAMTNLFQMAMEQETAMAMAAAKGGGSGGAGGGFGSAKGNYTFKDPWMRLAENFVEGWLGMDLKDAAEYAGKYVRENGIVNTGKTLYTMFTGQPWPFGKSDEPTKYADPTTTGPNWQRYSQGDNRNIKSLNRGTRKTIDAKGKVIGTLHHQGSF